MTSVRIKHVTVESGPEDAQRSARLSRRLAELVGRQLSVGDAVAPRPKISVRVGMPSGMSDERLAHRIAREVIQKLR